MGGEPKEIIAIAYLNDKIKGSVYFYENESNVTIDINLTGLPKNASLGFHIHAAGDLSDGCTSACAHFNPFNTVHGGKNSTIRHVGDLGNIKTDKNGEWQYVLDKEVASKSLTSTQLPWLPVVEQPTASPAVTS